MCYIPTRRRAVRQRDGVFDSESTDPALLVNITELRLSLQATDQDLQGCNRHLFTPNFSRRAFPCGQLHNTDNFLLRNVLLPNGPKDIKLHTFPTFLLQIVFLLNPAKCQISYNRYPYLYNKSTSLLWTVPS